MTESQPVTLTDAEFDQAVSQSKGIVVGDFWAPWCGPCHTMAPALDAFAAANASKIRVFKLDVEENPKTAEKYEIRSVPTVIFFRNGQPAEVSRGALTQAALQGKLDTVQDS